MATDLQNTECAEMRNVLRILDRVLGDSHGATLEALDTLVDSGGSAARTDYARGYLACAFHLYGLLGKTTQGRQAIADLGFDAGMPIGGVKANPCLRLNLGNADQVQAELELLAQATKTSAQLRELLLDLGELSAHLRCVQRKDLPAVTAGEVVLDLQLSDALAGLVSAVRAGGYGLMSSSPVEMIDEMQAPRADLASSRAGEPSIGLASSKAMHPADKDALTELSDMTRIAAAQEAQARHLFRIASALERVVFDGFPLRNQ